MIDPIENHNCDPSKCVYYTEARSLVHVFEGHNDRLRREVCELTRERDVAIMERELARAQLHSFTTVARAFSLKPPLRHRMLNLLRTLWGFRG